MLWKELVALLPVEKAIEYLRKATELVPNSVDLWLARARLEPYISAKEVLNSAIRLHPYEVTLWTHAARLEETQENDPSQIIRRAVRVLRDTKLGIERKQWLDEAISAEKAESAKTAKEIVQQTADFAAEKHELPEIWLSEAEQACN